MTIRPCLNLKKEEYHEKLENYIVRNLGPGPSVCGSDYPGIAAEVGEHCFFHLRGDCSLLRKGQGYGRQTVMDPLTIRILLTVFIQTAKLLRRYYASMTPEQRRELGEAQKTLMKDLEQPVQFNG